MAVRGGGGGGGCGRVVGGGWEASSRSLGRGNWGMLRASRPTKYSGGWMGEFSLTDSALLLVDGPLGPLSPSFSRLFSLSFLLATVPSFVTPTPTPVHTTPFLSDSSGILVKSP